MGTSVWALHPGDIPKSAYCILHPYIKELSVEFTQKGWTYRQQDNRGPGAARNLGAGFAKGEFIMFMDDDNYAKAGRCGLTSN